MKQIERQIIAKVIEFVHTDKWIDGDDGNVYGELKALVDLYESQKG